MNTHSEKLLKIQQYMQPLGFKTQILAQSEEILYEVLLIEIKPDPEERDRFLTFTYFPPEETEFESIDCLQLFCQLPFSVSPTFDLARYLFLLNRKLPLGTFALAEAERMMEFRHVLIFPPQATPEADFFQELVPLTESLLDIFCPYLEKLSRGELNFLEAAQSSGLA
ncbi:MAG: hypothetical protein HC913_22955 [Microscillaceae bacterium]|nr:hypothetical protein [Microscillaceae bacterium]